MLTGYGERVRPKRMLSLLLVSPERGHTVGMSGALLKCLVDKDSCHFNCQDHLVLHFIP